MATLVKALRPRSGVLPGTASLLLAAAVLAACGRGPVEVDPGALPSAVLSPPSPRFQNAVQEGRAIARSMVAGEGLPGLSLAVAVEGDIVWAEGFGWADLESRARVTPATLFRIGGVSEALTATAVGLLAERGRLDLDAPVQRYVPDFPEKEWPVSVRQLMAHRGGLRPQRGEGEIFRKTSCADDAGRLAIFAHDPLRYQPGSAEAYSPYGWVLVGAAVAAAAGEPYLEFMGREVFTPLGMSSTIPDAAGQAGFETARFYYPSIMLDPSRGLQDAPTTDLSCILPAGGFLSTPSDLVRFGSAMMDATLLDPATVAELQAPVKLVAGESAGQALGWSVQDIPMDVDGAPVRIVGRGLGDAVRRRFLSAATVGGHAPGGTASLVTVPGQHIAIAVAANVSGAESVSLLAIRLAEIFKVRPSRSE